MIALLWLKENWRLVIGIAALAVSFFTGWKYGAASVQARWDKEQAHEMKLLNDGLVASEAIKFNAQVKEQQANDSINYILDHPPVSRVSIYKAACPNQASTASGSQISIPEADRTAGTSGREAEQAQAAMDKAVSGMRSDAAEWGRALAACIVIRDSCWPQNAN